MEMKKELTVRLCLRTQRLLLCYIYVPFLLEVKCEMKWNEKSFCLCLFQRSRSYTVWCDLVSKWCGPCFDWCIFKINEWNVATCTEFVSQPEIEFYRMGLVMVWQCLGLPNLNCCAEFDSTFLNLCILKVFFFFGLNAFWRSCGFKKCGVKLGFL